MIDPWNEWLVGSERAILRDERGRTIRIGRSLPLPAGELWAALTTPERLARWLGGVSGDLVPGGVIEWSLRGGKAHSRVLACEPRRRLKLTWEFGAPGRAEPDEVELRVEGAPQGAALVLEHRSAMAGAWERAVGAGWELTWLLFEETEVQGRDCSKLLSDRNLVERLEREWRQLEAARDFR